LFGAAINIVECSVRLQSTKKKAKVPVSAAPPNSIESEADCGDASDAHLSQSATDLGTQIELPGGGVEGAESQTIGASALDRTSNSGDQMGEKSAEVSISIPAGPESVTSPRKVILADFNRLMAEIEASSLVQEELIRTEPQLASAATFLEIVSSGVPDKLRTGRNAGETTVITVDAIPIKEAFDGVGDEAAVAGVAVVEDVAVITARTDVAGVMPAANITAGVARGLSLKEARCEERMRVTRITAAKSLLKDELKKAYPSSASIAAFRKAAYGEESCGETSSGQGCERSDVGERIVEALVVVSETIATGGKGPDKVPHEGVRETIVCRDEGTVSIGITSGDDEMSIGESDDGDEMSDDYSVSGRSTSEGESVASRGNRKRRADESPEREVTGSSRKGFAGVVSRSEAGCRIQYLQHQGPQRSAR